jgi:hypothetical protein
VPGVRVGTSHHVIVVRQNKLAVQSMTEYSGMVRV